MSQAPAVNWKVPLPPKLDDVCCVPPVGVEVPVGELHHLSDRVQERVEGHVEHRQPDQVVRNLKVNLIMSTKARKSGENK